MKKSIIILIALIILLLAGIFLILNCKCFKKEEPITPPLLINSFEECIAAGYPALESYPQQCMTPDGKTFFEDIGNELEKLDLIRINSPRPNQAIKSPLEVKGEARGYWFFEASFPVKLLDDSGQELGIAIAQAQSDWMVEDFVQFETTLEFQMPTTNRGVLILEKDNPSGLPENADELRIPVVFSKVETLTIKTFFNNDKLDPEFSCNKVFSVEREIPKTQAVARAALEELLKGPTEKEKSDGYFTNINTGVKVQSLIIENGVAKIDFDERLEYQVGGSCRVAAIRAQITETLKQFSTVSDVIISVNGRTEDILQP